MVDHPSDGEATTVSSVDVVVAWLHLVVAVACLVAAVLVDSVTFGLFLLVVSLLFATLAVIHLTGRAVNR